MDEQPPDLIRGCLKFLNPGLAPGQACQEQVSHLVAEVLRGK